MIVIKVGTDTKTGEVFRKVKTSAGGKLTIFGDPSLQTQQMLQLGKFALANNKARIRRGIGSDDQPMPNLKKGYAIAKGKLGKGRRRDLTFTGKMLNDFQIRSVSASQIRMDISTRDGRIKARANEQRSQFWGFTASELTAIAEMGFKMFGHNIANMGIGGGRKGPIWMDPMGTGPRPIGGIGS